MASEPLVATRTATAQPAPATTKKSQKAYQLTDPIVALQVNQEFDRLHERINAIVTEATALADLDSATATAADCATRLNAFGAILRQSGLLKSS
jgi:hypothetical protein